MPPNRKKMGVDFYRVSIPHPNGGKLEDFLDRMMGSPPSSRNVQREGNYIRLQEGSASGDFWSGEIIRIRMEELPVKAALNGTVESLDLKKDEGLGEGVAFLYHLPSRVLALQRTRFGISASTFAYYMEQQHQGLAVDLDIILEEAAISKLDRMDTIRDFEIQIAPLDNLSILRKQKQQSVNSMISISEFHQAPHISVRLKMGRRRGTLERVTETAKNVLKITGSDDKVIEKMKITGQHGGDDPAVLDLLEHRMREHVDLSANGPRRTISFTERKTALRRAWDKRQREILEMFSDV